MAEACATVDVAAQTLLDSLDGAQQGDPSARPSACSHSRALSPPAASGCAAASAHTVAGVQLCNGRAQEMLLDVFNTDEPADGLLHRLRRWQEQQHSHH